MLGVKRIKKFSYRHIAVGRIQAHQNYVGLTFAFSFSVLLENLFRLNMLWQQWLQELHRLELKVCSEHNYFSELFRILSII